MFKTLLKKQLYELFALMFLGAGRSSSKKKKKSKAGRVAIVILFIILFVFLFFSVMVIAFPVAMTMTPAGYGWLLYIVFGLMAIIVSVGVNAFIACSMLFKAKDNSFLLSMPIAPRTILLSRMSVLFINCIIVCALVWLPSVVMHSIFSGNAILSLLFGILMMIVISMIVLVLACLIGWIIAILTRNKTTKIILSLIGFFILFCIIFGSRIFTQNLIVSLIENVQNVANLVIAKAYPLYLFGMAACGDLLSFIIVFVITAILFSLVCWIMSKTFVNIVSSSKGVKRKVYKEQIQKSNKLSKSLQNKEWSFLFKTPTYLINCGLSNMFFIIIIIAGITQISQIQELTVAFTDLSNSADAFPFNVIVRFFPIVLFANSAFFITLATISTPSISVEGKTIWILKSLPIDVMEIFKAKLNIHVIYSSSFALIFIAIFGILIKLNIITILLLCVCVVSFSYLCGIFGLFVGLKRANLNWTNITIPIKQNLAVLFSMLFGFALLIISIVPYVFLAEVLEPYWYLTIWICLYLIVSLLIYKWLKSSGVETFIQL